MLRRIGERLLAALVTICFLAGIAWAITPAQQAFNAAVPGFSGLRLTLTTGVPVTVSDVTNATTIYLTPYTSNKIALYYGSQWKSCATSEISIALGTLSSGKAYDVFAYDSNGACSVALAFSAAWTSATARNNALATQDGVQVLGSDHTRLYVGTFYTVSTTQVSDTVQRRFLWNQYNRVNRTMKVAVTTSHTYNTASWQAFNNDALMSFEMVRGFDEDAVHVTGGTRVSNSAAGGANVDLGVGVDSSSADSSTSVGYDFVSSTAGGRYISTSWAGFPGLGYHIIYLIEWSTATATTTWAGTQPTGGSSGMAGFVRS